MLSFYFLRDAACTAKRADLGAVTAVNKMRRVQTSNRGGKEVSREDGGGRLFSEFGRKKRVPTEVLKSGKPSGSRGRA